MSQRVPPPGHRAIQLCQAAGDPVNANAAGVLNLVNVLNNTAQSGRVNRIHVVSDQALPGEAVENDLIIDEEERTVALYKPNHEDEIRDLGLVLGRITSVSGSVVKARQTDADLSTNTSTEYVVKNPTGASVAAGDAVLIGFARNFSTGESEAFFLPSNVEPDRYSAFSDYGRTSTVTPDTNYHDTQMYYWFDGILNEPRQWVYVKTTDDLALDAGKTYDVHVMLGQLNMTHTSGMAQPTGNDYLEIAIECALMYTDFDPTTITHNDPALKETSAYSDLERVRVNGPGVVTATIDRENANVIFSGISPVSDTTIYGIVFRNYLEVIVFAGPEPETATYDVDPDGTRLNAPLGVYVVPQ